MGAYSKATWLWISFVMIAMIAGIGVIEVRVPAGRLSTWFMLGVVMLGFGSIFVWLYRHRTPYKPATPLRHFRLVGREGEMIIYAAPRLEESLDPNQKIKKDLQDDDYQNLFKAN